VLLFPFARQSDLITNTEKQHQVQSTSIHEVPCPQNTLHDKKETQTIVSSNAASGITQRLNFIKEPIGEEASSICGADCNCGADICSKAVEAADGRKPTLQDIDSSDVRGEWSGGVQIRRGRHRRRRSQHSGSAQHERYAVIFDSTEDFPGMVERSVDQHDVTVAPPLPERDYPPTGRKSSVGPNVSPCLTYA